MAALFFVALLQAQCRKGVPKLILRLPAVLELQRGRNPRNVTHAQIVPLFFEENAALVRTLQLQEMQEQSIPLFRRGLRNGLTFFRLGFARFFRCCLDLALLSCGGLGLGNGSRCVASARRGLG